MVLGCYQPSLEVLIVTIYLSNYLSIHLSTYLFSRQWSRTSLWFSCWLPIFKQNFVKMGWGEAVVTEIFIIYRQYIFKLNIIILERKCKYFLCLIKYAAALFIGMMVWYIWWDSPVFLSWSTNIPLLLLFYIFSNSSHCGGL